MAAIVGGGQSLAAFRGEFSSRAVAVGQGGFFGAASLLQPAVAEELPEGPPAPVRASVSQLSS